MTGITTAAVLGVINPHQDPNCLAYRSCNGKVFDDVQQKIGGRGVNDGEIIAMKVDTINWKISWSIGAQQLAGTIIP